jgi:hypothetical protein
MKRIAIYLFIIAALQACKTKQSDMDNTLSVKLPTDIKLSYSFRNINNKEKGYVPISDSMLKITTEHVEQNGNYYKVTYKICNKTQEDQTGVLRFNLEVAGKNPSFFLPGFIYGTNRADVKMHPKCRKFWPRLSLDVDTMPYANHFFVRSDRLSYPVSMVYVNKMFYGISGSPYRIKDGNKEQQWMPIKKGEFSGFNGFGCKLGKDTSSVSYTLGYENAPWLYIAGSNIKFQEFTEDNCISITAKGTKTFDVYVYAFKNEDERGQTEILKHQNKLFHQSPAKDATPKTAMQDLTKALFDDGFNKESKLYCTSVQLVNDTVKQGDFFSIAWTGGIQVATPMLMSAIRMNNEEYRNQALESIQNMVDNSLNPKSGLPFDAFYKGEWTTNGWWEHYIWIKCEGLRAHSSYLAGQALYYVLKAYEFEKTHKGVEHNDWLAFVKKVSDKIETTKNSEHEYPYRWSPETGEAIDYDAIGGVWCAATRAYLATLLNDSIILKQAEQSMDHYWNKFVKKMECYGTPHDIWMGTEEEGVLGFVKAAAILHRYTGEDKYLEYLRDGIDYEFTWKYCYNTPVQIPPLSKLNWSSSGASGTSIANPHIHPMGNIIADDIWYLYKKTGEEYYKQRLSDIVYWPLQSYNSYPKKFDHGKKGWMSERHCPHEGLLIEKYPDGSPASTWFIYHTWAAGCALESLSGDLWEDGFFEN